MIRSPFTDTHTRSHVILRIVVLALLILAAVILPAHVVVVCAVALALFGMYEVVFIGVVIDVLGISTVSFGEPGAFLYTSLLCIVVGCRMFARALRDVFQRSI